MTHVNDIGSLAVFASGSGTNLQAILDRFGADGSPDPATRVALVVGDRPDIGAYERAERAGVPTRTVPPDDYDGADAFAGALLEILREHGVDMVALAGYLKLVPARLVEAYRGRIVNIHPGPLPAFGGKGMYGERVHEAVLEAGVRVSGPTIHFVDERYDTGPIIAQWPVPVLLNDTSETLARRVLQYEHRLYPAVISALARGELELAPDGRVRSARGLPDPDMGFELTGERRALDSVRHFWTTD